ncbi:MAG: hypothetical protein GY915_03090, partial [bacterium]|nr:hypothetical protein [bacterium]
MQAAIIMKEVLAAKLEIGLRHATIPKARLQEWDEWLNSAIRKRAELGNARTHKSALSVILKTPTLEDAHAIAKTMQIMESLTKKSELQQYYVKEMAKITQIIHPKMTNTEEIRNPTYRQEAVESEIYRRTKKKGTEGKKEEKKTEKERDTLRRHRGVAHVVTMLRDRGIYMLRNPKGGRNKEKHIDSPIDWRAFR